MATKIKASKKINVTKRNNLSEQQISIKEQALQLIERHSNELLCSVKEKFDAGNIEFFSPSGNRALNKNPLSPLRKLEKELAIIIATNANAKAVIVPESYVPESTKESSIGSLEWRVFIAKPNSYRQQVGNRILTLNLPDGNRVFYFGYFKTEDQIEYKNKTSASFAEKTNKILHEQAEKINIISQGHDKHSHELVLLKEELEKVKKTALTNKEIIG